MIGKTVAVIGAMLLLVPALGFTMKITICAILDSIREGEWGLVAICGMLIGGAIMSVIGMGIICAEG